MPRGSRRAGTPGVTYSNRTDLNGTVPVMAAPDQPYGEAGAQRAAQQAVPLRGAPPVPRPPVTPDQVPNLLDPTARPGEPVTAGLPVGAGPGPEVLGMGLGNAVLDELREAYRLTRSEALRDMIEDIESGT